MGKQVEIIMHPCPNCGAKKLKYNPPELRKSYKGEVIAGKYTCLGCGAQLN